MQKAGLLVSSAGETFLFFIIGIGNRIFLTVRARVLVGRRGRVNAASVPQRRLTARPGLLPLGDWTDCKKNCRFSIGIMKNKKVSPTELAKAPRLLHVGLLDWKWGDDIRL